MNAIRVPLHARVLNSTVLSKPDPRMSGYNWHERWLTTLNPCTRSGIGGYEKVITIFNAMLPSGGGARLTVKSLALVGADADSGYFQLGALPSVAPGDIIKAGESRPVAVMFRPAAERAYACRLRLITVEGSVVEADLAGIGIETHEQIGDHDFGSVALTPGVQVTGTVELHALAMRPLEVRGLRILGDDRASFAFAAGFVAPDEAIPSTWWELQPGEKRLIALVFAPGGEGMKTAQIEVTGDEPACENTVGTLTGRGVQGGANPPTAPDMGFESVPGFADPGGTLLAESKPD